MQLVAEEFNNAFRDSIQGFLIKKEIFISSPELKFELQGGGEVDSIFSDVDVFAVGGREVGGCEDVSSVSVI